MTSFKSFLTEGVGLSPFELKKTASAGPNEGEKRIDILADLVKKQNTLTMVDGAEVVAANVEEVLASIEQFKSDGKAFKFKGLDGKEYSTSKIKKTAEFGGGGGAGGGTVQTATAESAQCLWMSALLGEGRDKPIEYFTDEVLSKYFKNISVGKTSLKDCLEINDSWKQSSYICAQYAIKNGLIERGMTFHRDDRVMKTIYSRKNTAFKNNGFKPLTDDKWNPGDIWAVKKGFDVSSFSVDTVESYNDDILDAYLGKRCVAISLKKVKKACKGTEMNVERPPETDDFKYTSGHIKSPKRGEWHTTKANYITYAGGKVDLRANTSMGSHKAEIQMKGARGGGVSWGFMQSASEKIYGRSKALPDNNKMRKFAKALGSGDLKAIKRFTEMLNLVDKRISAEDVAKELGSKRDPDVWAHGKLGGLYVLELIHKGGQQADKFVTQLVNYAGSSTTDSSAYIKLSEK